MTKKDRSTPTKSLPPTAGLLIWNESEVAQCTSKRDAAAFSCSYTDDHKCIILTFPTGSTTHVSGPVRFRRRGRRGTPPHYICTHFFFFEKWFKQAARPLPADNVNGRTRKNSFATCAIFDSFLNIALSEKWCKCLNRNTVLPNYIYLYFYSQ